MSPTIWTQCAAACSPRPLSGRFQRVVESQFRNSTRKLVDSDKEQELLEELLDTHAKAPVPPGFEGLHYLLYTPFRHPPLRNGSRFGTRHERGILYASRELPTALCEVAYYRLVFLDGSAAALGTLEVELTAFSFGLAARRAVDLSRPPFAAHEARISSKTSYEGAQQLGLDLRGAGVQACLFTSARTSAPAQNLAVFEPVFKPAAPSGEQRWHCTATRARVEFRRAALLGPQQRHAFDRAQFEVDGVLPTPAA